MSLPREDLTSAHRLLAPTLVVHVSCTRGIPMCPHSRSCELLPPSLSNSLPLGGGAQRWQHCPVLGPALPWHLAPCVGVCKGLASTLRPHIPPETNAWLFILLADNVGTAKPARTGMRSCTFTVSTVYCGYFTVLHKSAPCKAALDASFGGAVILRQPGAGRRSAARCWRDSWFDSFISQHLSLWCAGCRASMEITRWWEESGRMHDPASFPHVGIQGCGCPGDSSLLPSADDFIGSLCQRKFKCQPSRVHWIPSASRHSAQMICSLKHVRSSGAPWLFR